MAVEELSPNSRALGGPSSILQLWIRVRRNDEHRASTLLRVLAREVSAASSIREFENEGIEKCAFSRSGNRSLWACGGEVGGDNGTVVVW